MQTTLSFRSFGERMAQRDVARAAVGISVEPCRDIDRGARAQNQVELSCRARLPFKIIERALTRHRTNFKG